MVSLNAQRRLPWLFLLLAVACLGVAFAQFRLSSEVREAAVVLAVDVSRSMLNDDVQPDRLSAAKDAARLFLAEVPEDFRVGLVTFGNEAQTEIPPSPDRAPVATRIDSLDVAPEAGTVIGDGLEAAVDAIRDDRRASGSDAAAILLLSDGADTGSTTPVAIAAESAAFESIPVFTVVLGTRVPDPEERGAPDYAEMERIANATGGDTFTAETAGELTRIYERLGATLSTQLAVTEIGIPFIVAAGVCVLLAAYFFLRTASRF